MTPIFSKKTQVVFSGGSFSSREYQANFDSDPGSSQQSVASWPEESTGTSKMFRGSLGPRK